MQSNYFETIFEELCEKLKRNNDLTKVSKDFMKVTTDCDRIRYLFQFDLIRNILQPPQNDSDLISEKCTEKSCSLRNEGNALFKSKKYRDSVQVYTESLAWAPLTVNKVCDEGSDCCAALAFANRSAALFQLAEYQSCLEDINRAFSLGYPHKLSYKLHDRRGQCLQAVGRVDDAVASLIEAKQQLGVSELNRTRCQQLSTEIDRRIKTCKATSNNNSICQNQVDCDKTLPQLCDGICPRYPSLSGGCAVKYAADRGRYIVAEHDIYPGDVILVEKSYASIVLTDNRLDHCDYCFKPTLAAIPCLSCHHALFCGEDCRAAAWSSYHCMECQLRSVLELSGVDKFAHLAVRTVLVSQCSTVLEQARLLSSSNADVDDGIYSPQSYRSICSLVTNADQRSAHDLFRRSAIAIFLVRCLQCAGFFDCDNPTDDSLIAVSGVLLNHLQSFPCNAHEISEFDLVAGAVAASVPHELGAGIYATLSLFNHSCNPAVSRNFYGDTCVVRAIRTVRAGQELSDNYGAVYAVQSRDERRNKLRPQYYFECGCEACVSDWPLFTNPGSASPMWRCDSCYIELASGALQCPSCSHQSDVTLRMEKLRKSDVLYRKAFNNLLECRIEEALRDMLPHLRVMDELICLPWPDYSACQEAVKQCFSIMANCRVVKQV